MNGLSQGLDLPPVEKLSLLGCDTLVERATRLLELLEFHALERAAGRAGAAELARPAARPAGTTGRRRSWCAGTRGSPRPGS